VVALRLAKVCALPSALLLFLVDAVKPGAAVNVCACVRALSHSVIHLHSFHLTDAVYVRNSSIPQWDWWTGVECCVRLCARSSDEQLCLCPVILVRSFGWFIALKLCYSSRMVDQ